MPRSRLFRRLPGGLVRGAVLRGGLLWAVAALPVLAGLPRAPAVAAAQLAGLVVLGGALAACRRPLVALPAAFALPLLSGNFAFGLPLVSYRVGRRSERARPVVWAFTLICGGGAALNVVRGVPVTVWFPLTVWLVLLGVLPWLAGRAWRQYTALVRAGWQRAEQLEREQRIVAERERLRERSRIAQDMHDSLGHELSLIALRAGALELAADLDERHRAAAARVREAAATATQRLQEIIGVLREDAEPAPLRPGGGPAALRELVERAAASGMPVAFDLRGDAEPAPPLVEGTVYRVVQEALTNAAKHAPGASVTVEVTRCGDRTRVVVVNTAPAGAGEPAGAGGGLGLAGLRERVRLTGGTLRAGPLPGGGFAVRADLPHTSPARLQPPADACAPDPAGPDGDPGGGPYDGPDTVSGRQLARWRHRLRRELVTGAAALAALLAGLGAVMAAYYVYVTINSVLPPSTFAQITVGQTRAEIDPLLPRRTLWGGAAPYDPPAPPGTDCALYRPDANPLGLGQVYRLCFAGGRLAAKDVITRAGPGPSSPAPARPASDE